MPLSRLLAIALLALSFTAFAQNKQNDLAPANQPATGIATASEPWRILPKDVTKTSSSNPVRQVQEQGITLEDVPRTPPDTNSVVLPFHNFVFSPSQTIADSYCLKIRSYVVARDSKDSDSTHFVSYSTCQPASRYRLKTIELQAPPAGR